MVEKVEKKKSRKVLVTGSGGMLGTDLCEELAGSYAVIGLDIKKTGDHKAQTIDYIECDITDSNKTATLIIDVKPDLIIHAAAWTDVDGCETAPERASKINWDGTINVVFAAKELKIPLVYISTDFVFDGRKKTPYTEEDTPNAINAYSASKLYGEKTVSELDEYVIVRSGWLFGANGKNFVDTVLEKARSGEELRVVNDQIGAPTYTRDLAKGIEKLLGLICVDDEEPICGIYHISNKGAVSWFDFTKEILRLSKIRGVSLEPITSNELDRPAKRPLFSVLDNAKFERATAFSMRPWQEALRSYLG